MSHHRARAVARRREKLKERDQDRVFRRAYLERILDVMGIRKHLPHLDDDSIRRISRVFNPKPRVVPDPLRPGDRDLANLSKEIQRSLDRVTVRVGPHEMSFNDYHSACVMIALPVMAGADNRGHIIHFRDVVTVIRGFVERYDSQMWEAFQSRTRHSLCEASAMDSVIYSALQELVWAGDHFHLTTILKKTPAKSCSIEANGIPRKSYLCCGFDDLETGEVSRVGWDAGALGLGGESRLPVYIQSHALRQAHARLGLRPEYIIHHTLWRSLDEPVLSRGDGGTLLVEYRILGHKVGYLVAEPLEDKVLVRTFLLVTMQGTPEGSEFARRLRLCRPDIEYLELDRLGTLVRTDLARDPQIADLLRDCGCGGALELAAHTRAGTIAEGYAARFRRYTDRILGGLPARYSATQTRE